MEINERYDFGQLTERFNIEKMRAGEVKVENGVYNIIFLDGAYEINQQLTFSPARLY
jgi:hypothetical protein